MSDNNRWTAAARWGIAAAIGALLTFGLCKAGTPFLGHGTSAQDNMASAGFLTFIGTVVSIVLCIFYMLRAAFYDGPK